jgi:iron(III) transport system ATP-binding protein|tara:strand:- start:26 stop:1108 length:1083 start_codon:yes stop_codon:yes gene_type:complete
MEEIQACPSMEEIRADGITKRFGNVTALKNVSLKIASGELFFLLGGSGCGKTTLLRCIAGLETPTEGRVFFGDRDVTGLPTHKREAAMVFQSYALWPHMTVGQNIAFGLEERKVEKKEIQRRVEEALKMVKLDGFAKRGVDQMSGGQQQRVSLARALVVRPKCLLLDEPLSNLDAQLRLEMRSEIRRIVKENDLTGIYVTHDQAEALSMADRMAVMAEGGIAQVGPPEEIYRQPISSYVAGFIGETNLLKGTVREGRQVETPNGVLTATPSVEEFQPIPGSSVILSIRPEAVEIVNPAEGSLGGRIIGRIYLGSLIQYSVGLDDGTVMQVTEQNPQIIRSPGDNLIGLRVSTEDVTLLER